MAGGLASRQLEIRSAGRASVLAVPDHGTTGWASILLRVHRSHVVPPGGAGPKPLLRRYELPRSEEVVWRAGDDLVRAAIGVVLDRALHGHP